MNEEDKRKKKEPPISVLPDKQVMPMIGLGTFKLTDEKLLT